MTHPIEKKTLASFGKALIKHARDRTIKQFDKIISGGSLGDSSAHINERINALGPDARAIINDLIPMIVDRTLHNIMGMLSDEDNITVSVTVDDEITPDINKVSDGLYVDLLYWIENFSKQRQVKAD